MILRHAIEITAPAAAIFDFFDHADANFFAWHPDHRVFRWTRGRGLQLGNRFHFEEIIAGKLLKKTVEFTRIEAGRCVEFAPTFWLMRWLLPRIVYRLEPIVDGVWRVVAEIHLRVGPLSEWLNQREFAAVREHMRVEGVNLKRIVESRAPPLGPDPDLAPLAAGNAPVTASAEGFEAEETPAGSEHEALVQRRVDARCLEHQLIWVGRGLVTLPVDLLWGLLAWNTGVAVHWWLPWLVARLLLHVSFVLKVPRWQPLVESDPAEGLRRVRRWFLVTGLLHATLMPFFYFGTDATTKLLAYALGSSYFGGVIISASGQQRTFWAMVLPSYVVYIAGWAVAGGWMGWAMVVLLLHSIPLIIVAIRQQRRSWETLVRLADDRERLAASLAVERDRARAAADARTRFFAAASHDLRQPLHALAINATTLDLLTRRGGDAQLAELSQGIGRSLAQSQGLLDALLDISRLDAGAVKLNWAEHDIAALLRQLHAEHQAMADQRGLAFTLRLDGADACWARTDADQLQRVLHNLLDNAFKFTTDGGVHLELSRRANVRTRPDVLCIRVADTGCGIPPADRERVFEEFHQVDNPARDRTRGLGLGLAIVRRTATLLGAEVQLTDAPQGPGCVFEVRLPALATRPRTVAAKAATNDDEDLALSPHVLVVDDEVDILQAYASLLEAVGWHAQTAESLDAALALARDPACRIDIAVVDHRLPQGDGVDVIQQLRALRPGLPSLVVTGDVAVQWQVRRHGLRVLHKPLDGATLTTAISEELAAATRWAQRLDGFTSEGEGPPMNIIDAIHGRRSIRVYQPKPVPREVIEDLLWHAIQVPLPPVSDAASSSVCVVEGSDVLADYGAQAKQYAAEHQPPGEPWTWPTRGDFDVFWGAPALVIFCAREGHPEAPFDCCRAGQNLALLAHARGLGSCWVGSPIPWLKSAQGRVAAGLPDGFDPEVAMVLGYPDGEPEGRSRARPVVHWKTA